MRILLDFFYPDGVSEVDAAYNSHIREIQDLIGLHGASTAELILKYAQERYKTQAESKGKSENGMITFRVTYCDDTENLKVEILNCRQLNATDSNGRYAGPFWVIRCNSVYFIDNFIDQVFVIHL